MKKTDGSRMNEAKGLQLLASLPNPQIGDLHNWLYEATGGLCAPAKASIAKEIEEHFRAAVEDGLAEGRTQIQAELAAMQSLGSAKAARREFKKVYATKLQHRWSRYGKEEFTRRAKALQLAFGSLALCTFIILVLKEDIPSRNSLMWSMVMVTAMAGFAFRWPMNPLARSKKWSHFVRDTLTEVAIVLQLWILHSVSGDLFRAIVGGVMLFTAMMFFVDRCNYYYFNRHLHVAKDGRLKM
jgi:hypothetical protein